MCWFLPTRPPCSGGRERKREREREREGTQQNLLSCHIMYIGHALLVNLLERIDRWTFLTTLPLCLSFVFREGEREGERERERRERRERERERRERERERCSFCSKKQKEKKNK